MKVMVIPAHHDDEVLGCGGTIYKHVKNGDNVFVSYVGDGSRNVPGKEGQTAVDTAEKESAAACRILGVHGWDFLREEDRFIQYGETSLKKLISSIREVRPDRVYTHHGNESDRDHSAVYEIVKEAYWLAATQNFPDCGEPIKKPGDLFLFEVWTPLQDFQHSVDISDCIDVKLKALRTYRSVLRGVNYDLAIKGLNAFRGEMFSNCRYAEVFKIKSLG